MAGISTNISSVASASRIKDNPFIKRSASSGTSIESCSTTTIISYLFFYLNIV
jgi:hypothetical protein